MSLRLLCAGLLVGILTGCSTDLDVTAPYKESTIVYALLDKNDTRHLLKINKAFLGDGDAFVYAQIADSNEYTDAQLQATVERLNAQGNVVASYPLRDTILDNHAPGIFYGPQHKLYYFDATLDPNARYRISATAKGNAIVAETPIVGDFSLNGNLINPNYRLPFAAGSGNYSTFTVKWSSGPNGKRYEFSYRFNYDEVRGNDTVPRSFTRTLGSVTTNGLGGNEALELEMSGQGFYQTVAASVPDDPAVSKRIFRGVDLLWAVAGPDLHTYLQLASPISGIVEERPTYSNVQNGYGLFTTRTFKQVLGKQLNDAGTGELVFGQYTGTLHFCIPGGSAPVGCN